MIIDKLSNSHLYAYNEDLKAAFDYLQSLSGFPAEEGKVEVLPNRVYANIDRYTTKPEAECRMEAHEKFIDIQVLFSGRETIFWHPVRELTESIPYDSETDVAFYEVPTPPAGKALLKEGIFMLLYPEDGHMPQIAVNSPELVEKIVMKIKVC